MPPCPRSVKPRRSRWPFSEAKENVGGFSIIDVPNLDAAIAIVKEWPSLGLPEVAVEIRPIVDHSGDM
jgi:hypothetical protein